MMMMMVNGGIGRRTRRGGAATRRHTTHAHRIVRDGRFGVAFARLLLGERERVILELHDGHWGRWTEGGCGSGCGRRQHARRRRDWCWPRARLRGKFGQASLRRWRDGMHKGRPRAKVRKRQTGPRAVSSEDNASGRRAHHHTLTMPPTNSIAGVRRRYLSVFDHPLVVHAPPTVDRRTDPRN